MYIRGCEINWMLGWANQATIKLYLGDIPDQSKIIHTAKVVSPNMALWYGQKDGFVSFYADRVRNIDTLESTQENGFGGRHFTIMTEKGPHVLKGPWSSRPSVMNEKHPTAIKTPCIDVAYTDELKVWIRGYTYYAGNVNIGFLNQFLKTTWGIEVERFSRGDYVTWGLNREKILKIPEEELMHMRHGDTKLRWRWSTETGYEIVPLEGDGVRVLFGRPRLKEFNK